MGTEHSLIIVTAPARDQGTAFLMRGNDIWNYDPRVDRTTRREEVVVAEGLASRLELAIGDTLALIGQGRFGMSASGLYLITGILRHPVMEMNNAAVFMPLDVVQFLLSADDHHIQVGDRIVLTFENTRNELVSGLFNVSGLFRSASANYDEVNVFVRADDMNRLLGNTPDAFNQIWNLPTDPEIITGEGWVNLFAKEMNYQFDRDYYFDSSKFNGYFDYTPTPNTEAVRKSIEELRLIRNDR